MTAKQIKSTGPVPCQIAVVAERPGREEASRGYVLCGPSGQELDRYLLNESDLDRPNVYCTNLVKDYRDGENPEEWEVARDFPLLVDELVRVRPRYVMALGLWSARAFLGDGITMEWASGLHFPLSSWAWPLTVMPVIHTAAGFHHAPDAIKIAHGFRQFGKLVKEQSLPVGHLRTGVHLQDYTDNSINIENVVAMDTEGTVDAPWGLSYCCRPGVASVQHERKHRNWTCKNMDKALVVLHHAIHDLPILAKLGVRPRQFADTMLMAALLGTEPLGLKALARRWSGMVMQEYDEIVAPARREKALEYLGNVLDYVGVVKETI